MYQNRRWDAEFLTLRRLVSAGATGDGRGGDRGIGTVHRFESRFERFRPDAAPKPAGGGTLLDLGSHLVDQALTLFGPATRVYAELHTHASNGLDDDSLNDDSLDDDVFVALHHRGGVLTHLWASAIQGAPGPRYRVAGSTGSYVVDLLDGQEDALRAGRTPATEGDQWGVEPPERWGRIHRGDETEPVPSEPVPSERGRWDTFYPAFAAAVRGAGPVPVDPWDAVAALQVIDAARASAARGQVVEVPA